MEFEDYIKERLGDLISKIGSVDSKVSALDEKMEVSGQTITVVQLDIRSIRDHLARLNSKVHTNAGIIQELKTAQVLQTSICENRKSLADELRRNINVNREDMLVRLAGFGKSVEKLKIDQQRRAGGALTLRQILGWGMLIIAGAALVADNVWRLIHHVAR